jgi:hypothetical protein
MSGVFKAIGKGFKKVIKGVGKVVKAIWKPLVVAAVAYFAVGMASGHFGDGSLMAKMPGFGEEGIFTKTANFLGMGTGGGAALGNAAGANASYGVLSSDINPSVVNAGLPETNVPSLLNPTAGAADPLGLATLQANGPPEASGGILNTLKNVPFGGYYLGAQAIGGMAQSAAQEEATAENKRQFDTAMGQRQKEFDASQHHQGAFYGVDRDGQGIIPQISRVSVPQASAPLTQSPQVRQLTVDDLLKLQAQGQVR